MRVRFARGQQRAFLERVRHLTGAKAADLARRIGGRRHIALYGNPGTPEGRSRGGRTTQKRFRLDPEYFRSLGVAVRKQVNRPALSTDLAEFVGIVLGDGSITNRQVTISCNSLDAEYAEHVKRLIFELFGIQASSNIDEPNHVISVTSSGIALVELLEELGLRKGNKVNQQVDVPAWIWQRHEFQTACLRGLMDTDGCVFRHSYRVNGKVYTYTKLAFTNYSRPLLLSAKRCFEALGLAPTLQKDGRRLYLHNSRAVHKYFELVGTHNPRYRQRYLITY
jgi:intein/homing endonuclease